MMIASHILVSWGVRWSSVRPLLPTAVGSRPWGVRGIRVVGVSLDATRIALRRVRALVAAPPAAATLRTVQRSLVVTRERVIEVNPAVVWAVVADPRSQERLDARSRRESATGDWRSAGSQFVLAVRGIRWRYVVSRAEPGVRWTADVERGGRPAGVQDGELTGTGTGTLLRWTVTMSVGPFMRRLAQRSCERELPRWLAAVERESVARRP